MFLKKKGFVIFMIMELRNILFGYLQRNVSNLIKRD